MVSRELAFLCRDLSANPHFLELVEIMSKDSLARFTSADPKNMAELQAARSQYDAVQDMLSLIKKYANIDRT